MDREKVVSKFEQWCDEMEDECPVICLHALALLKEQKITQKDGYNLQELWKRARTGETLNEAELNFLLADWDERNIFKQPDGMQTQKET